MSNYKIDDCSSESIEHKKFLREFEKLSQRVIMLDELLCSHAGDDSKKDKILELRRQIWKNQKKLDQLLAKLP